MQGKDPCIKLMNLKKLIQKGQTGIGGYIGVVVTLFVLVLMLFAFTLAAVELNDSITLGGPGLNESTPANAIVNDGVAGMASFAGLLPAIFIVAAIGVLLLVLLGAVGVFLRN